MVIQNMLRTCEGKQKNKKYNLKFVTTFDLKNFLKQIPISLYMYAPIFKLPSKISIMAINGVEILYLFYQ